MTGEKQRAPLILEIKGNSLDDGPGIRSVVFFKGCPLSCVWCHNPESKCVEQELSFDPKLCVACNSCIDACAHKALSRNNPAFINRERCVLCFTCAGLCPSEALSVVGREMSVDEIVARIAVDRPFFETSGGGVTLSGGEPTLCLDFAAGLAKALKKKGIRVLLETCGLFDHGAFMKGIYPSLDMIYFDIKLIDPAAHKKYCGVSNEKILDNFARILDKSRRDGKIILPRTPLVPGITDTDENLKNIASFLRGLGADRAALLAYNPLWHEKSVTIGADDALRDVPGMKGWMPREEIERCRAIFLDVGIEV